MTVKLGHVRHADRRRLPARHRRHRRRSTSSSSPRSAPRSRSARWSSAGEAKQLRLPRRRHRSRPSTGFGVFLSVGSATGDSFKWPSFLPVRIDAIGIEWADVENHPEDFVLVLSASVTGIKGLAGLEFSGSIQGIRIQPSLLAAGQVPDHRHRLARRHGQGQDVRRRDRRRPGRRHPAARLQLPRRSASSTARRRCFKRVFYLGLQGGFSMAGMAGFTIRIGLSELGPLQVFLNVEMPGGILLEPHLRPDHQRLLGGRGVLQDPALASTTRSRCAAPPSRCRPT